MGYHMMYSKEYLKLDNREVNIINELFYNLNETS